MNEEIRKLAEDALARLRGNPGCENATLPLEPVCAQDGTWIAWEGTTNGTLPFRIVWSKESGKCYEVHGGICQQWLERGHGGPNSDLGLPVSDEKDAPESECSHPRAKCSRFINGTIYAWPIDPNNMGGEWTFEINKHALVTSSMPRKRKHWELPPKAVELKNVILSKLDEIDHIASTMLPPEGDLEDLWKESKKEALKIRKEIRPFVDAFDSSTFFIVTFGMLKAGKSTLVNALVGHPDVSPVGHGETTKRSSIIFAADAEHPEGIYIYKPKGNCGDKPEDVWHKELCESLILALGGVGSLEEKFDLEGGKPLPFSKNDVDKLLTKKPPMGALPPVIRISPEKAGNLLDDGVAILDTPGLDGLEANKTTDSFWQVLPSQGDFFLLVQSSMSGLNADAAGEVGTIYKATERKPGILIVYNKIVSEFWLSNDEKEKKLEKDAKEVETYLRKALHDVSKGADIDIVSVNAGAASAALFGNPEEFSPEFSKNPSALLEQSRIADLAEKLRGMLQRSRMQIKIDRLKGLIGQRLASCDKDLKSKLNAIPELEDFSKSQEARKKVREAMDKLLATFADLGKSTAMLTTVATAAVSTFTKTVSEVVIEEAVNTEGPSGSDDPSRDSCIEAVTKILQRANEDCCRDLGDTIVSGTAILQTEPWCKFHLGEELEQALDIVMEYLYGVVEKDAKAREFLANLFYYINKNSLEAHISYSTNFSDSDLPRPKFANIKLGKIILRRDYVRRKDWDTYAAKIKTRLVRHYISKNGDSPASAKLKSFVIDKMKAAGKEHAEYLQKLVDQKIEKETDFETSWSKKNNCVLKSMELIHKLEEEIHKAISEE